jgi:hypothetical protein
MQRSRINSALTKKTQPASAPRRGTQGHLYPARAKDRTVAGPPLLDPSAAELGLWEPHPPCDIRAAAHSGMYLRGDASL